MRLEYYLRKPTFAREENKIQCYDIYNPTVFPPLVQHNWVALQYPSIIHQFPIKIKIAWWKTFFMYTIELFSMYHNIYY